MQVLPIISRFTFGEVSPLLSARVDLPKHQAACKTLENFIPLLQGPIQRRGGTRFVARTNNGPNPVALIDFAFSETTAYVIEAGHRYLRFYYQGRPVMNGNVPYQIGTPWNQADLFYDSGICALKWVQSGDVMYIVCPGRPPQKLSRYGHTDWRLAALPGWGSRPNATAVALFRERLVLASGQTVYFSQSGAFENFELRSSNINGVRFYSSWGVNMIGADIMMTNINGYRVYAEFVSGEAVYTPVDANTILVTPTDAKAGLSRVSVFEENNDGKGALRPNTLNQSISLVYTEQIVGIVTFNASGVEINGDSTRSGVIVRSQSGVIAADDPMEINVYSEQMDRIEWLVPAGSLLAGTTGGEFRISETTTVDPLGPENIKVVPETNFGSAAIQALRVGAVVIFAQRSGRKVREFVYDYSGETYKAMDLTVAAEHITRGGLTAMIWQSEPIETLWCVRKDGQLLGFTYSKDQEMTAWHRHTFGGGGAVSHAALIPAGPGGRDDLWLSVRRVVGGQTVYYLETMDPGHEPGAPIEESFFVDCGRTVTGSRLTEITGLGYLEGLEVAILGDGGVQKRQVVQGGRVALQYPANVVQVGLPFESLMTTVNLEMQLPDGTAQSRTKRLTKATLWLLESSGGEAGNLAGDLEALEYRRGHDPLGQAPPLFSGLYTINWPHGYERDGEMTVRQRFPLPFTLLALIPEVNIEGKG